MTYKGFIARLQNFDLTDEKAVRSLMRDLRNKPRPKNAPEPIHPRVEQNLQGLIERNVLREKKRKVKNQKDKSSRRVKSTWHTTKLWDTVDSTPRTPWASSLASSPPTR